MPSPGVAAVDRALTILSAFEDAPEPMTLAELARRTGMYKSTLLRLVFAAERPDLVMWSLLPGDPIPS